MLLHASKTKDLTVDLKRKTEDMHNPTHIYRMAVECVSSFTFLGVHISGNLSWYTNTSSLVEKAHQWLFFLWTLKKTHLSSAILVNFYQCTVPAV